MKTTSFFLASVFLTVIACTNKPATSDTTTTEKDTVAVDHTAQPVDTVIAKVYANDRFKEVTVEKIGDSSWRIKGKAQIFEATFSWVVEDGHNELLKGFHQTDAGAPDWGNFDFTINLPIHDPIATLHLILFESSPKDGSRQYELPVLLP